MRKPTKWNRDFCGAASWNAPIIDGQGTVYAANYNGQLLAVNDFNGDGIIETSETYEFTTDTSALHCGSNFAPGMMVVPTCDTLFVFQY